MSLIPLDVLPPETPVEEPLGTLDILSVGSGHLSISFDKNNPGEIERAKTAIDDMLKRGYTILVEFDDPEKPGKKATRVVKEFDPATCEYLLEPPTAAERKKPGPKPGSQRVRAARTKARAVAPTGGG